MPCLLRLQFEREPPIPLPPPVPLEGTDKGIALRGFCVCFEKCSFVSVSVSLCVSQALCTLSYNDNDVIELSHILRNWIESYNTLILHPFESRWEQILFCGFEFYYVRVTVSLTSLSLALSLALSSCHHKSTEKKIPLLPSLLLSFPPIENLHTICKETRIFSIFLFGTSIEETPNTDIHLARNQSFIWRANIRKVV